MMRNAIIGLMAFCLCTVMATSPLDGYWKTVSGQLHDLYLCVSDNDFQGSYDGFAGSFSGSLSTETSGSGLFVEAGDFLGGVSVSVGEDGHLVVALTYFGGETKTWELSREAPNAGNKCGTELDISGVFAFNDGVLAVCVENGIAVGTYYGADNLPVLSASGHSVTSNFAGGRYYYVDGEEQGYFGIVATSSGVTLQTWELTAENDPLGAYDGISLRGEVTLGKRIADDGDMAMCMAGPAILTGPKYCPEPQPQIKKVNNIEFRFADLFNGAVDLE